MGWRGTMTVVSKPIHPFPARMAPEISRRVLAELPRGSRVIDPMCGSGTVLRNAVELGHDAVGVDLDPLAVLLSRSWTTPVGAHRLLHDAQVIVDRAMSLASGEVRSPWSEIATGQFAEFWFGEAQRLDLLRLSTVLRRSRLKSTPFLWVCLSRLIITKDHGASLARDVSHGRPHRVMTSNGFDVFAEFVRAARLVARRLEPSLIHGTAIVVQEDARLLSAGTLGCFDVAITSPPYLNAIDYLRAHRLSLIWMGYEVSQLQVIRAEEVGAERTQLASPIEVEGFIAPESARGLAPRFVGWVRRYASDMEATMRSLASVVRPEGVVVVVVGNSLVRGASIDNAGIVIKCAEAASLKLVDRTRRAIPARRRYLPPPTHGSPFAKRMREESVLTFAVPRV